MTAKKIIEILKGVPEDTPIQGVYESTCGYVESVNLDNIHIDYDSVGTKVVFKMKEKEHVAEKAA